MAEPRAERDDDRAGGDDVEHRRARTMIPVKIGMNSHTRRTKKPSGSADATASTSVTRVQRRRGRGCCARAPSASSSPSMVSSLTRGSMRCSSPGAEATSLENIVWRISTRPAVERLGRRSCPCAADRCSRTGTGRTGAARSHAGRGRRLPSRRGPRSPARRRPARRISRARGDRPDDARRRSPRARTTPTTRYANVGCRSSEKP